MTDSSQHFSLSAEVYGLLYESKETAEEVQWILRQLVQEGFPDEGSIVEFGSGTGRHASLFAALGHQVVGVEQSDEMLARAHSEPGVSYIRGDGRTVNVGQEFDAVLALFHVLSYQRSLADVRAFFHNAARHLRPGGLFGFDVWFTPAVHSLKPESRVLTRENGDYTVVREATPIEDVLQSLVDVLYHYSVTDKKTNKTSHFEELHPMRHFTKTEIELFGEEAGFDIVDSLEFMTDDQPSRDTWGVWFTLKKR